MHTATTVLTHRGLDPSKEGYFAESSLEAFTDQLKRGFGLEFDVRRTADNQLVVLHDATLSRITDGADDRRVADVMLSELLALNINGSHLTNLDTLLERIQTLQAPHTISALHLKYDAQDEPTLDLVAQSLIGSDPHQVMLFDVTIPTAHWLKKRGVSHALAPSIAHPYDIERYNTVVGGTLLSVDEVLAQKDLFEWVWLDEWDRSSEDGGDKKLYTQQTFDQLRNAGFNIALVTPELHATSPGLLGGEAHADAANMSSLQARMQEIVQLCPDALCTDYPDYIQSLVG